ncbi:DUF2723 domain-containing protein [Patescibacteria group bacterium]|nr:DUF2723 domain-containing protein [Patescibacteria group bacterium]MBU1868545.1 DUF2723 domain-containing protein [Patescibacteria group bacterium]
MLDGYPNRSYFRVALAVFFTFIACYSFFACRTIYGGDSGDLVVAAYKWGIPHSPGYPLYTILGALWIRLFRFGVIAWRMNLFSALTSAATLAVLFLALSETTRKLVPSLISTLCLGFAYTFWQFSQVAEVFSLNNLFALSLFYSLLVWRRDVVAWANNYSGNTDSLNIWKVFNIKHFSRVCLLLGLSVAHQQMIVLFFPAYGYIFLTTLSEVIRRIGGLKATWRVILVNRQDAIRSTCRLLLFLLVGPTLYLYHLIVTRAGSAYLWRPVWSMTDLVAVFLRKEYGTFSIAREIGQIWEVQRRYFQVYPHFLLVNFSALGGILALIGFVVGVFRQKIVNTACSLAFLFSGLLFLLFASIPFDSLFRLGMLEKFALSSLTMVPFWLALALSWLQDQVGVKPVMLMFILPAFLFFSNVSKLDLRNVTQGADLAEDILLPLADDAIVYLNGDDVVFNSLYLQEVESVRPDLKLIYGDGLRLRHRLQLLYKRDSSLVLPEGLGQDHFLIGFIRGNIDRYPIYSTLVFPDLGDGYTFVPRGYMYEILPAVELPPLDEIYGDFISVMETSSYLQSYDKDFAYPAQIKSMMAYYQNAYKRAAHFFINVDKSKSLTLFEKAIGIWGDYESVLNLGNLYAERGECGKAEDYYREAQNYAGGQAEKIIRNLYVLYRDCYQDEGRAKGFLEELEASGH